MGDDPSSLNGLQNDSYIAQRNSNIRVWLDPEGRSARGEIPLHILSRLVLSRLPDWSMVYYLDAESRLPNVCVQ